MNKYLEGIKRSDNVIINEIYTNFFTPLKIFILNNNGNETDAKDVFQEVLIATFKRLQKKDFEITTTFGTYIFSVGKYIWFKKLKTNKRTDSIQDFEHGEFVDIEMNGESKYAIFIKGISKLGVDCKKVLNHYFERKSFKEIAKLMKYNSEGYARRKKYLCTQELIKIVKADPNYLEIYTA